MTYKVIIYFCLCKYISYLKFHLFQMIGNRILYLSCYYFLLTKRRCKTNMWKVCEVVEKRSSILIITQ